VTDRYLCGLTLEGQNLDFLVYFQDESPTTGDEGLSLSQRMLGGRDESSAATLGWDEIYDNWLAMPGLISYETGGLFGRRVGCQITDLNSPPFQLWTVR
jgi:hypothetical protein